MNSYITTAEERWPGRRVIGDGPYAVTGDVGPVYLCLTESQQKAIALGVDRPVMVNLHPVPFDRIPDRESPEERRQRRREARA